MAEPTLTEIFGAGATQTETTITISKADLPGLTATATNRAESLLVAVLLKAKAALTPTTFDTNADQSVSIEEGFESIATRNNQRYYQRQLAVYLHKLLPATEIDPDDY